MESPPPSRSPPKVATLPRGVPGTNTISPGGSSGSFSPTDSGSWAAPTRSLGNITAVFSDASLRISAAFTEIYGAMSGVMSSVGSTLPLAPQPAEVRRS